MPLIANSTPTRQLGLTLIELMISIAIGLLVVSGIVYLTTATLRTNTQSLKTTRLNQELRSALHLITRDLKRAGSIGHADEAISFSNSHCLTIAGTTVTAQPLPCEGGTNANFDSWVSAGSIIRYQTKSLAADGSFVITKYDATISANNTNSLTISSNPFPGDELSAGAWVFANPHSSTSIVKTDSPTTITYSYDSDNDGAVDCNELFGFRYDDVNDAIESVIGETSGGVCARASWEDITDPQSTVIDAFTITEGPIVGGVLSPAIREYTISITGHLPNDASVQRTVQETVKLRNDPLL